MSMINAVVLASGDGTVIDPDYRFKGLLPVGGRPMVAWVVDALREASTVGEIAVVLPTAENLGSWVDTADTLVLGHESFIDNLSAGMNVFTDDGPVLIVTGDVPALSAEAIDDFVRQALERNAEFAYAVVHREAMEAEFPGGKRTYIKMSKGLVTGGNVAVLTPDVLKRNRDFGQHLFETRKSAVRMARLLGARVVLGLLLGRLRPADLERRMGHLLSARCCAIFSEYAGIGMDVDKPADRELVERVVFASHG